MSVINAVPLLAAAGGDYQISRSVRLRSSASAYFNRTFGTPTNNKIFTLSGWIKIGTIPSSREAIFVASNAGGTSFLGLEFNASAGITLWDSSYSAGVGALITTQVFRDPSSWYHIVFAVDTTQATASNRCKLYLNGSQITSFSSANYPSQNSTPYMNSAVAHSIGSWQPAAGLYFDGYLTEINFIDGQALTPSSFGETDAVTGVWKPKRYAGTYGTNGFYLNFSDNSSNTAATIGKDYSGNGNNWTPNNISVTAGVTYDSMLDTPTPYADGGNGRGNYAVLNPVNKALYQPTISDGNLRVAPTTVQYQNVFATFAPTSGKWYAEVTVNGTPNSANMIGVSSATEQNYLTTNAGLIGATSSGYGYYIYNGNKYTNGSSSAYGNSIASGDVVGIALDLDNGKVFFSKNGTWQASGDPVAGTNAAFTGLTSSLGFFISSSSYSGGATSFDHNFGQRPFTYTPPSGYVALNTQNLPDSTIKKGNQYFDVSTWTGDGTSSRAITNSGSFQPDLVWTKARSGGSALSHLWVDSVRGATLTLSSDQTAAEYTLSTGVTAFNSNGFQIGTWPNSSGQTEVGWQWKAGSGTTSSNTSGSITSTVSVNATAGFSVVTFTSPSSGTFTVGHGLGVAPKMVIIKDRGQIGSWSVYHASATTNSQYLLLNSNAAVGSSTNYFGTAIPSSTVFGANAGVSVQTSDTCVAYCFSEVAGYSAFGSYTGNGNSSDGPFVYLGFRPRWIMVKRTDASEGWEILDTSRNTFNAVNSLLEANLSSAEITNTSRDTDYTANGFKVRNASNAMNASGGTYIYAAFAENPFKNALAR